jgi:HKD family nuclease
MGNYITIGYAQSKLIRTPLHLNTEWNTLVNSKDNFADLFQLISNSGTLEEYRTLLKVTNKTINNYED